MATIAAVMLEVVAGGGALNGTVGLAGYNSGELAPLPSRDVETAGPGRVIIAVAGLYYHGRDGRGGRGRRCLERQYRPDRRRLRYRDPGL
jgi:hypothetical protein